MTRKDLRKITGMTEPEMQHCERLARVGEVVGERVIPLIAEEGVRAQRRAERRGVRQLHRTLFERTPEDCA
jgi:hypothetical protein